MHKFQSTAGGGALRGALHLAILLTFSTLNGLAASGDLKDALAALRSVGPAGKGTPAAQVAWKRVAAAPASALPDVLAAMDGSNDFALNWIRTAVDAIASRADSRLPMPELHRFIDNTSHHPRARRLAYELIAKADPAASAKLLPKFLNDPSAELRRDAVQAEIGHATTSIAGGRKEDGIRTLQKTLSSARDIDQIETIAKQLKEQGQSVDLQKTFGWVTRWKLVAPFDNKDGVGFERAFGPETNADLGAEYDAMTGKSRWRDYQTTNEYGLVDFNKPFTQLKSVGGYALAEFHSDKARPAELRLGCKNGWKIWFNGKYVFGRDEYHRGAEIDQYRMPVDLKAGKNTILVKCLQNEQKEDWTVEWEFQLRITDAQGTPIVSTR